ncbi:hypothetical protein SERLADRAFT_408611 [Serpula lacrymans var. lacrymans S7.9]|uniref:Uncharacterized protein n=1 Tax=Serpula lacrymans var. lacrymans (strain S7.9) TaxID=578457 RepID=F8NXT8_SERL9|nr:uncharacterized protein SERLADRAFT_408611 [Serpula lacrymans var. lacrymans S7.9]EGO24754.1 hypothetical protein SERLADRAFT_408611 [Serpula lacrymans var. lacrymans S7.9]
MASQERSGSLLRNGYITNANRRQKTKDNNKEKKEEENGKEEDEVEERAGETTTATQNEEGTTTEKEKWIIAKGNGNEKERHWESYKDGQKNRAEKVKKLITIGQELLKEQKQKQKYNQ